MKSNETRSKKNIKALSSKILILFALLPLLVFINCKKEDKVNSLAGTTWKGSQYYSGYGYGGVGYTEVSTIIFTDDKNFIYNSIDTWDDGEKDTVSSSGTYTYDGKTVVFIGDEGGATTGAINGNIMTLNNVDEGVTVVLTKQ
jgi:hypothetical protein